MISTFFDEVLHDVESKSDTLFSVEGAVVILIVSRDNVQD